MPNYDQLTVTKDQLKALQACEKDQSIGQFLIAFRDKKLDVINAIKFHQMLVTGTHPEKLTKALATLIASSLENEVKRDIQAISDSLEKNVEHYRDAPLTEYTVIEKLRKTIINNLDELFKIIENSSQIESRDQAIRVLINALGSLPPDIINIYKSEITAKYLRTTTNLGDKLAMFDIPVTDHFSV